MRPNHSIIVLGLLALGCTTPAQDTQESKLLTQVQTISIDRNEAITLNNQVIDLGSLSAQLLALKQANPDVAVVIRPDRDLPVQKLVSLMDALQHAQITKVGIATKAETK